MTEDSYLGRIRNGQFKKGPQSRHNISNCKSHGKPKFKLKYHIELDQFPTICKQMIELKIIIRTTILAYGVCFKFLSKLAQS